MPSKWVAHCHCTICRRAHGAAFVTWVGMHEQQCIIEDGDNLLRWYDSSPGAQRGFCSRCGSTLFFRSNGWLGELHIVLANFVDQVDRAPQVHVFFDTHVDWYTVADHLPKKPPPPGAYR
jgi:hypothetical protein